MKKCYIINYDLRKAKDYDSLIAAIKAYGTWAKPLKSCWLIVTDHTAVQIRNSLSRFMDSDDGIIVLKAGNEAAWRGIDCKDAWLQEYIKP